MIVKRGVHVYGLLIIIEGFMKRIEEVLRRISGVVSNIYFVNYHPLPNDKSRLIVYFDVKDPKVIDEMVSDILRLGFVEDVKVLKPKIPGLLIDTESFPLRMGVKQRAIVFGDIIYRGLLRESRRRFGSTAEAFLFYLGLFSGEEAARSDMELAFQLNIRDPVLVFSTITAPLMKALGYCSIEIVKIEPENTSIIRVYDSFECEIGKPSDKPFSHFLRGFIAGLFSGLFKQKYTVKETKCIAKGDPYCEFIITRVQPVL